MEWNSVEKYPMLNFNKRVKETLGKGGILNNASVTTGYTYAKRKAATTKLQSLLGTRFQHNIKRYLHYRPKCKIQSYKAFRRK